MRPHRFIGNFDFSQNPLEISNERTIRQIVKVLRLKAGDSLILGDGKGKEYRTDIKRIDQKKIYLMIRNEHGSQEIEKQLVLYCAICKKENFEFIVQKATEIGITQIVPILTERTVKKNIHGARLLDIAREASEHAGRRFVPTVSEPRAFSEALREIEPDDTAVLFDPTGEPLQKSDGATKGVLRIFIGPEGGWTEKEKNLARTKGTKLRTLGENTLRAETAAVIGVYMVLHSRS